MIIVESCDFVDFQFTKGERTMLTNNKNVLAWVDEMVALCKPAKVVWLDGSEEQLQALREEAVSTGEMMWLNQEKLPGCMYHRTAVNDVARSRIVLLSALPNRRTQVLLITGNPLRKCMAS